MKYILSFFIVTIINSCHSPIQYDEKAEFKNSSIFVPNKTYYFFTNFQRGIKYAKQTNKKAIIIFSAYTMSSSGIEWDLFQTYDNPCFIRNNYVIIWLLVDDKSLIDSPYMDNEYLKKDIKTVGDENYLLQAKLTKSYSQPSYCIIDTNLNPIRILQGVVREKETADSFLTFK